MPDAAAAVGMAVSTLDSLDHTLNSLERWAKFAASADQDGGQIDGSEA